MCNTIGWLSIGKSLRRRSVGCGMSRALWSERVFKYINWGLGTASTALVLLSVILILVFVWVVITWACLFIPFCMRIGDVDNPAESTEVTQLTVTHDTVKQEKKTIAKSPQSDAADDFEI